jgi:hypothetical protein
VPKIEAAGSSEMILMICQTAQYYIPADSNLQFYLLDVTPLLGGVKWTDVNLRGFGGCTTLP